jgi:hypothetical protein
MSAHRDLDRLIQSFLAEGPMELPDPSYDEVRDRMEQKRQRAFIGPWRTPDVNRYLKIGLAAAAVVLIAVVGFQFLGDSNTGGPGTSESAEPSPSADRSYVLLDGPPQITVTLPAAGWDGGEAGGGILVRDDNTGMITFTGPLYVYGDPCHWESTTPATPATTVDELVAALAAQPSRDASDPVDVTVGGYAGKSITLHVPDDIAYSAEEFTDCDQGYFGSFGSDAEPGPARYHQGLGQIDELWILDVGGVLVTIDTAYYARTPAEHVEEMRAIVESATFELP